MAETVLSVIAEEVLNRIISLPLSEISLAWGLKKDLKKLGETFSTIKAVLLDAEEKKAKNHEVRDWLEKLKDVVYDVDDVMDEFSTEALRRKVEIHGSMLKEVSNFFSCSNPLAFRFKIGHKIKDIKERLDDIALDRGRFHFAEQAVNTQFENGVRDQTHSFVPPSKVEGRIDDKEKLVELLLSFRDRGDLSIIPIVGLGGLGKTTLAKLVYNDENVIKSFEVRIWVCVSEDFRLKRVTKEIITSATGVECVRLNMDQLQTKLRDILNAKKFLLVLDDVWNDDPKKWAELKDLLIGGANGSAIIVTTRSNTTASIMGTTPSYNLGKLPNGHCLSLFMRCAFKEGHEKENPELMEIGKEIVHKCGGVPLAVKTLGSLLYMKSDVQEWLYIRDNEIWKLVQKENDILPVLQLSYEKMPSYLKRCFAYCSIFPKDYEIDHDELIYLWMAQGLIHPPDESRQPEDIGNQYCNELLSRSFLQVVDESFDSEIESCKMHDLVHDLAQLVAGTEFLNVNFNSTTISERVRHVSFGEHDLFEKEFPVSLLSAKKLQSFTFSEGVGLVSKSFVDTLIFHFQCLRVLDLSEVDFEELPGFVGKLKHLRYLDLSYNRRLKILSNSVCKLVNLQTLNLGYCEQLQDLPIHIGKLISVRYLMVTSQLICLPEKGLQGLASLQILELQKCNCLVSLSEGIRHLTSLRKLNITDCPSLTSLPSGMKQLTALRKLVIWNCKELNLMDGEDMQGLKSLQSLTISGPNLVTLPLGLQQSSATLQHLAIGDSPNLTALPEWLQTLASLKVLHIWNFPNLLCLPEGMRHLTALRELEIQGCPHLSRRCKNVTGEDWPKISHIPQIDILSDEYLDTENSSDGDSDDEDLDN